jgi:hypothetical protein
MYTSIRVTKTTARNLERYRASLALQVARQPERYPAYLHSRPLGMGTAIDYLLAQQRRHTARSGAAKLAKARKAV